MSQYQIDQLALLRSLRAQGRLRYQDQARDLEILERFERELRGQCCPTCGKR